MNFTDRPVTAGRSTEPYFLHEAAQIADAVRQLPDMKTIMNVSDGIAEKTRAAYNTWGEVVSPAIFAYVGDVYKGFFAQTLTDADIQWAQQHLRILSGLYGALRPLDSVSAYRLEMKAKLPVSGAKNLYEFWGDRVATQVDKDAKKIICVLSSDEYAKVVVAHSSCRIVTPVFLDTKADGTIGTVPIYSKMMRGVMARWMIDNRIETPDRLKEFSMYGYAYDHEHSTEDRPAFYRAKMTPLRFVS